MSTKRRYFGSKTWKADVFAFAGMSCGLIAMYRYSWRWLIPAVICMAMSMLLFPKLKTGENLYE